MSPQMKSSEGGIVSLEENLRGVTLVEKRSLLISLLFIIKLANQKTQISLKRSQSLSRSELYLEKQRTNLTEKIKSLWVI
jgi:hypothetical protein